MDLYALYEYRKRRPTFFLEAYRLSRHVEEDAISRDEDFRIYDRTFALTGIEIGGKYAMARGGLIDARLALQPHGRGAGSSAVQRSQPRCRGRDHAQWI